MLRPRCQRAWRAPPTGSDGRSALRSYLINEYCPGGDELINEAGSAVTS
jgi:hypothetical protein